MARSVNDAPPSPPEEAPDGRSHLGRRVRRRRADGEPRTENAAGRRLRVARSRLALVPARTGRWFVASLPAFARALRAAGVVVLLFIVFVVVFGAMRHTTRQAHYDQFFRERVASGHASGPGWRPLPGQAIATLSIPSIDLREVVVQDTTPELLQGAPGHLIDSPLPGSTGNSVILGRRITDGAAFRDLGELTTGDAITVVTPQGAFAYRVTQVVHVAPGEPDVLGPTPDARLTLVTSGSWFSSRSRLAVIAALQSPRLAPAPVPLIPLRTDQLGQAGDSDAIVSLLPWAFAFVLALLAWSHLRRRIGSRWRRLLIATPPFAFILFFVFENAARLLPGTI
jgi:sortase A